MLANDGAEQMRFYLDRGRRLQAVGDDELKAAYVKAMADWAGTPPPWEPLDTLHDVVAEAEIRGVALPDDEVAGYLATIELLVRDRMEMEQHGPAGESDVIEEGIRAYQASRRSRN